MIKMTITPVQVKETRTLLGRSLSKIADAAKLTLANVSRFEQDAFHPGDHTATWIEDSIREALETARVAFVARNGAGAGVRLRK